MRACTFYRAKRKEKETRPASLCTKHVNFSAKRNTVGDTSLAFNPVWPSYEMMNSGTWWHCAESELHSNWHCHRPIQQSAKFQLHVFMYLLHRNLNILSFWNVLLAFAEESMLKNDLHSLESGDKREQANNSYDRPTWLYHFIFYLFLLILIGQHVWSQQVHF